MSKEVWAEILNDIVPHLEKEIEIRRGERISPNIDSIIDKAFHIQKLENVLYKINRKIFIDENIIKRLILQYNLQPYKK